MVSLPFRVLDSSYLRRLRWKELERKDGLSSPLRLGEFVFDMHLEAILWK